ncbi:MAG: SurA N-terminal domain-containing protein [Bdellovibrionaceae bacterium]|nr:SurA N-terminal domain-containing protein [Bdellovibrio sp.]
MKSSQYSFSEKLKKSLAQKGLSYRSIIAFMIFGMIVLVFVLSDMNGRKGGSRTMGSAAEVNGQIISIKDFQEEENRISQYYAQMFGGQFDLGMQQGMLRNEAMNSLVSKVLGAQAAEKEGIYATDAEVKHMITQELPYFKRDGAFQSDAYKQILKANNMTPGEFETKLRQDIKNQRSRQLFEMSMTVSDLQKNVEKEIRSAKLNLDFITLNPAEFAKSHEVAASVVNSRLADAAFAKKVNEYVTTNTAEFETPEEIRASHILIKSDAATEASAQAKAELALKRIAKEDFGKVASEISDDPGSKAKKGDLGYFSKGRMVKEFEEAAFALPVGQTSGLVKSSFGYHIIKVTDKKPFAKADPEKAKVTVAKRMIANEEYANFIKMIETDLAAGKTAEVLQAMAKYNMKWKETGLFDMSVDAVPVMNSQQAMKTSFELTKAQPLAKKLVREGENQYLLKLKDIKMETADLKPQDQEVLERGRSTEAYRSWVESFKKKASIETNTTLLQNAN